MHRNIVSNIYGRYKTIIFPMKYITITMQALPDRMTYLYQACRGIMAAFPMVLYQYFISPSSDHNRKTQNGYLKSDLMATRVLLP